MASLKILNSSILVKLFLFFITVCLIYISFHISSLSQNIPMEYLDEARKNIILNSSNGKNAKLESEGENINQNIFSSQPSVTPTHKYPSDTSSGHEVFADDPNTNKNEVMINQNSEPKNQIKDRDEILYVSRHQGTIANFKYIAKRLGFDVFNLAPRYDYGKYPDCFINGECSDYIKSICRKYKYIVIGDTTPDAYPFLMNECSSKIIVEITNRFDVFLSYDNYDVYKENFNKAINFNQGVTVVANNPYESFYMCREGIHVANHFIIRPAGMAPDEVLEKKITETHDEVAVIDRCNQDHVITTVELEKRHVKFKLLEWVYGGPLVLASYKAIVFLPYQVSIMKMMENFRYGVATLLPTERLFKELVQNEVYEFTDKSLINTPDGLHLYTEWYNDEFKDLFVYFDSWDEIPHILKTVDLEALKRKGVEFMQGYEKKILNLWQQAFGLTESKDIIHRLQPICQSNNGFFYNYS